MPNNSQYSPEFLKKVEELKQEIEEILQKNANLTNEEKEYFKKIVDNLGNKADLCRKYAIAQYNLGFLYDNQKNLIKL